MQNLRFRSFEGPLRVEKKVIENLCVIIRRPTGEEVSTCGIRTAWATHAASLEASILLIEDGVFNGLDNPGYNTALLKDFINQNGKVYCYHKDMVERGIFEEGLLSGIHSVEAEFVAEIISESDATLTF
jgi:sulfur relay (sulfurtransferase) DsrF/TusC family protein